MTAASPSSASSAPLSRFDLCVARVLLKEGGKVNHKSDRGGATAYGISRRFLRDHAGHPLVTAIVGHARLASDDDVMRLTRADARRLYRAFFWDAGRCGELPVPLDGAVFDQLVNGGGATTLQTTLNLFYHRAITVDGAIGPKTIALAARAATDPMVGVGRLLVSFRSVAENRYRDIVRADPTQKTFLAGWVKRAKALGDV